jgi:hypothetical protein
MPLHTRISVFAILSWGGMKEEKRKEKKRKDKRK